MKSNIPAVLNDFVASESCAYNKIAEFMDLNDGQLQQILAFMKEYQVTFINKAEQWRAAQITPINVIDNWSRQWEYPYTLYQILQTESVKILDAGSGITFFPFFLKSLGYETHSVDINSRLAWSYSQASFTMQDCPLEFSVADLADLPYKNAEFDAIVCISVLEHTIQREHIVKELHRILKPHGLLVLTFDLSLDGQGEIYLPTLPDFLTIVEKHFLYKYPPNLSITNNIITTDYYIEHDPSMVLLGTLSLWHRFKRQILKRIYKRLSDHPRLTVAGLTLLRK